MDRDRRVVVSYDDLYDDDVAQGTPAWPDADYSANRANSGESSTAQDEEGEEERLKFDKSRGLFLDSYTGLYYDFAANLYYNLTSMEQTSPCYHWDPASAKFLAVLVERIVRFAPLRPAASPEENAETEEGEFEDGEGGVGAEEEEEEEEEDVEKLAMSVRTRGLKERQSWCTTEDWKWDATSSTYYDTKTGLYYSPSSDLYMDYNAFPAAIYHRLSREDYVQVTPQEDVEQAKEAEEDTSIPSKLMLTLKHVDDDSQALGSFVIGDIERDDEAHKGDTANTKVFTLGRHRTNDVQLNDLVASKFHARITWQNVYWQNFYWLQDLGSNNGTFLNGKRLSESRVPSGEQDCPLQLNDHIIIGNTKMVVGRVIERPASPPPPSAPTTAADDEGQGEAEKRSIFMGNFQPNLNHPIFRALRDSMKEEEERQRRVQAKRKLYQMLTQEEKADRKRVREHYTDRAARRQHLYKSTAAKRGNREADSSEAVGSRDDEAPLPAARLQRPVPEVTQLQPPQENKGRSLLKRMGWKEGEGLGRENTGIVDPIQAAMSNFSDTTRGLGFGDSAGGPRGPSSGPASTGNPATSKDARWEKARERYHKLFGS